MWHVSHIHVYFFNICQNKVYVGHLWFVQLELFNFFILLFITAKGKYFSYCMVLQHLNCTICNEAIELEISRTYVLFISYLKDVWYCNYIFLGRYMNTYLQFWDFKGLWFWWALSYICYQYSVSSITLPNDILHRWC